MHLKMSSAKSQPFCLGLNALTHWPLRDVLVIVHVYFSNYFHTLTSWALTVKLVLGEFYRTPLMLRQYWFRQWLSAVRQQAITWANVYSDLYCHMESLIWREPQYTAKYQNDKVNFLPHMTYDLALSLTHCGLVTPYGDININQRWFRECTVVLWHHAITSTNDDLFSTGPLSTFLNKLGSKCLWICHL